MPRSSAKGDRTERELVNYLDSNGWAVMRAPASGSATARDLPDVLIGNGVETYAIEGKASGDGPIYLTESEVDALTGFALQFGATPLLGARWDEAHGDPSYGAEWPGWYFHRPETVYRTDDGNYRIKKQASIETGIRVIDL